MNRIESAATRTAGELSPLQSHVALAPVATPAVVAGVVGGAFLVGAAVGCAEGHCAQDSDSMNFVGDFDGVSVGDLLQVRHDAL